MGQKKSKATISRSCKHRPSNPYNYFPKVRHPKYAAAYLSLPHIQSNDNMHTSAVVY